MWSGLGICSSLRRVLLNGINSNGFNWPRQFQSVYAYFNGSNCVYDHFYHLDCLVEIFWHWFSETVQSVASPRDGLPNGASSSLFGLFESRKTEQAKVLRSPVGVVQDARANVTEKPRMIFELSILKVILGAPDFRHHSSLQPICWMLRTEAGETETDWWYMIFLIASKISPFKSSNDKKLHDIGKTHWNTPQNNISTTFIHHILHIHSDKICNGYP